MNQGLDYTIPEWILCYADHILVIGIPLLIFLLILVLRKLNQIIECQKIMKIMKEEEVIQNWICKKCI